MTETERLAFDRHTLALITFQRALEAAGFTPAQAATLAVSELPDLQYDEAGILKTDLAALAQELAEAAPAEHKVTEPYDPVADGKRMAEQQRQQSGGGSVAFR